MLGSLRGRSHVEEDREKLVVRRTKERVGVKKKELV